MAQVVRRSSAPATVAVARIKGSTSTISVQDATEKLTPKRRHAAYKRFTSGFVVMVLIEETFEAASAPGREVQSVCYGTDVFLQPSDIWVRIENVEITGCPRKLAGQD